MPDPNPLIPKHGGYRNLKSFQVAELVYDLTVLFCEKYIDSRSRTRDQMVQAARSGVQNIAEGSQASATSRKMEMKLTSVARASLEELLRDYEDYLRQNNLPQWDRNDPRRVDLIGRRPKILDDVAEWARAVKSGQSGPSGPSGRSGQDSAPSTQSTSPKPPTYPEILADAAIALITVACFLLDRQLAAQASAFQNEGGFTECLYWERRRKRDGG